MLKAIQRSTRPFTFVNAYSASRLFSTANASSTSVNQDPVQLRKQHIIKSLQNFSFELTPKTAKTLLLDTDPKPAKAQVINQLISLGKEQTESCKNYIFITKLPGHPQQDTIEAVNNVKEFNAKNGTAFECIPHIPVRGLLNRDDALQFLKNLNVNHVLIVGGSVDEAAGEWSESKQLLESGVLQEAGITMVGMASHPQGADNIEPDVLHQAFIDKLAWANDPNVKKDFKEIYWCTQLAYSVDTIKEWEKGLRIENGNNLRINLGLPGPASMTQLVKYAQMSGIGNSVNYFKNNPIAAWNLLTKRSVLDDLVSEISGYIQTEEKQMIGGFHFFTFGSLTKTLDWALKVRAGEFDMSEVDGDIRLRE